MITVQQRGQNHQSSARASSRKRISRAIARMEPSEQCVVVMMTELEMKDRPSFMLTCSAAFMPTSFKIGAGHSK